MLASNGLGFDGWLARLAAAASLNGRRIVASSGAPSAADPHCWQDVSCARR
jgi:zinc/manganese transport system substrate-binding protein